MKVISKTCRLLKRNVLLPKFTMIGATSATSAAYSSKVMIVGLGNLDIPNTRHSVGMTLTDEIGRQLGVAWTRDRKLQAFSAQKTLPELQVVLLKSKLPMNNNGKSVSKAASQFGVTSSNIYLVHDELGKTVGKYSIKEMGSAGGHNGVKSCISCLQTDEIPRLRIGIDRPVSHDHSVVADYVLSKFNLEESEKLKNSMEAMIRTLFKHIERRLEIKVVKDVFSQ